jgi:hypothetical protein
MTTAFTIRTGSRQTVHATLFPVREYQSSERPGAAPASISVADISACLPASVGRGPLVTEDLREVCPLSRRGDVIAHRKAGRQSRLGRPLFMEDSPSIRPITGRPSLPPSSLLRCLISALCSPPSLTGRQRGYFVHPLDRFGLRSCLSAGGAPSAPGEVEAPGPDHVPFGPSLSASLACLS